MQGSDYYLRLARSGLGGLYTGIHVCQVHGAFVAALVPCAIGSSGQAPMWPALHTVVVVPQLGLHRPEVMSPPHFSGLERLALQLVDESRCNSCPLSSSLLTLHVRGPANIMIVVAVAPLLRRLAPLLVEPPAVPSKRHHHMPRSYIPHCIVTGSRQRQQQRRWQRASSRGASATAFAAAS